MKRIAFALLTLCISVAAFSQDRGIGLRLGVPSGITYKKYLPRHKAIELGIGSVASGWHHFYYENSFRDFDRFEGYDYVSHQVRSALFLQARYLIDYDIQIEGMEGELDWYWGVGGVMKLASVQYRYNSNTGPDIYKTYTDVDFGPEGIIGMEYTFQDIPLTVFGEIGLMIEILDRPGIPRVLSGIGVRYNF